MTLLPDPKVIREYVAIWGEGIDTLASDGGHIVLWLGGCTAGMFMMWMGFDIVGDHLLTASTAGLGIALRTTQSNAKRKQEMSETTVTDVQSETLTPAAVVDKK